MDKSKCDPQQELQRRKRIEWVFIDLPFVVIHIAGLILLVILSIYIWYVIPLDMRNFTVGVVIVALCLMALNRIFSHNGNRIKELEKIVKSEELSRE